MPNFETSFIPEQGATYQGGSRRPVVAMIFSILITIIAIGLCAGAWWLQKQEEKKVQNLTAEIKSMESRFDIDKITMLNSMDKRIKLARDMFNKHPMPSVLIDYITDNTVSNIKWKSISISRGTLTEATGDTVELAGEGIGYFSLIQQLAQFRNNSSEVSKVELRSYHLDPRTNIVSLQMTLTIKPNFATLESVRAKNSLNQNTDQNVQTVTTPPTAPVIPAAIVIPPPAVAPVLPQVTKPSAGTSSKPAVASTTI